MLNNNNSTQPCYQVDDQYTRNTGVEVCMGVGFMVEMGFVSWAFHGKGNDEHISIEIGMGMGLITVEVGMSKKYITQIFPLAVRFIVLFLHLDV